MLFPEQDASVLKAWIVKRLETPSRSDSDVDADVLADYVLALLRHDSDPNDVRRLCETELYDFLKDEATPFVKDVFQAVTFRSYLPGAPPPPPALPEQPPQPPPQPAHLLQQQPLSAQQQQQQQQQQNGSKKRSYQDSSLSGPGGDTHIANGWDGQPYGGRAVKQPRRGGGVGGRGGRGGRGGMAGGVPAPMPYAPPYGLPAPGGAAVSGGPQAPGPAAPPPGTAAAGYMLPMETFLQMQQMGIPVPAMYGYPSPTQGAVGAWNHNGNNSGRRRGGRRCREFDKKGFCSRTNCKFEHVPPGADDYDPSHPAGLASGVPAPGPDGISPSALQFPPPFSLMAAAGMFPQPPLTPQMQQQQQQQQQHPRHSQHKGRRGGRSAFSADGPVHDQSKTAVVVEGIPDENLDEASVRAFFTQFGPVEQITMHPKKHLAIVKFEAWESANAAYQSPKVIFDNRFVKVFWYREPDSGANGKANRGGTTDDDPAASHGKDDDEPALDMDEFLRRQEEAQKLHEEKAQKKLDVERKRQEIEQRQRDLMAQQQQERQRLIAKMAAVATRAKKENGGGDGGGGGENEQGEGAATTTTATADGGVEAASSSASVSASKASASAQTEMIRAQLAALEEEARLLGLDPSAIVGGGGSSGSIGAGGVDDADPLTPSSTATSSWYPPRGGGYSSGYRGRGRGFGYRGRGGYGSRGGGANGSGGPHSAYAAYSLDNRPRRVAVTGVDFTAPEPDEAIRQFLLGIGDFVAIDTTPERTTITFTDRRTAEKFYYGLQNAPRPEGADGKSTAKLIPGIEQPVEVSWVAGTVPPSTASRTAVASAGVNGHPDSGSASKEEGDAFMGEGEEGENHNQQEQHEQQEAEREPQRVPQQRQHMDFDVADEDWDMQ